MVTESRLADPLSGIVIGGKEYPIRQLTMEQTRGAWALFAIACGQAPATPVQREDAIILLAVTLLHDQGAEIVRDAIRASLGPDNALAIINEFGRQATMLAVAQPMAGEA